MLLIPLFLGMLPFPSQADAQAKFDEAVARADQVCIECIEFLPKEKRTFIREYSARDEIDALSRFVRFEIPPPEKKMVDGREVLVQHMEGRIDALGCFAVELKKENKPILSMSIFSDDHVGIAALVKGSTIKVDKDALAPLWKHLLEIYRKKRANQPPEPTPPDIRPESEHH